MEGSASLHERIQTQQEHAVPHTETEHKLERLSELLADLANERAGLELLEEELKSSADTPPLEQNGWLKDINDYKRRIQALEIELRSLKQEQPTPPINESVNKEIFSPTLMRLQEQTQNLSTHWKSLENTGGQSSLQDFLTWTQEVVTEHTGSTDKQIREQLSHIQTLAKKAQTRLEQIQLDQEQLAHEQKRKQEQSLKTEKFHVDQQNLEKTWQELKTSLNQGHLPSEKSIYQSLIDQVDTLWHQSMDIPEAASAQQILEKLVEDIRETSKKDEEMRAQQKRDKQNAEQVLKAEREAFENSYRQQIQDLETNYQTVLNQQLPETQTLQTAWQQRRQEAEESWQNQNWEEQKKPHEKHLTEAKQALEETLAEEITFDQQVFTGQDILDGKALTALQNKDKALQEQKQRIQSEEAKLLAELGPRKRSNAAAWDTLESYKKQFTQDQTDLQRKQSRLASLSKNLQERVSFQTGLIKTIESDLTQITQAESVAKKAIEQAKQHEATYQNHTLALNQYLEQTKNYINHLQDEFNQKKANASRAS